MREKTYLDHENTSVFERPTFSLTKANALAPKKTPVEHSIGEETQLSFTFHWGEPKYSACGKEYYF